MMNNEQFLEESKKFISEKITSENVNNFFNLVTEFQKERLGNLSKTTTVNNQLFSEYFSPALNEVMENQLSRQEKINIESVAQHYTNSALIALRMKMQKEITELNEPEKREYEIIKNKANEEIEKLLNNEKKNSHKFHTVMYSYIVESQEFLYDHQKLALKGRSIPSIEERNKEIQKNKDDKKFNIQELEHPKLESQQFEREMKLLLSGEISENQINSVLKRVEEFQLGFVGFLKKKIKNPTGALEKLVPNVIETDQLKALKDWSWGEESTNVMDKVLKIISKSAAFSPSESAQSVLDNISVTKLNELNKMTEKLESIMLDIGSLKKYNEEVKTGLLDHLQFYKEEIKKSSSPKV